MEKPTPGVADPAVPTFVREAGRVIHKPKRQYHEHPGVSALNIRVKGHSLVSPGARLPRNLFSLMQTGWPTQCFQKN